MGSRSHDVAWMMSAKRLALKYLEPAARNRIARRYFGPTAEQYEAFTQEGK